MSQAQGAFEKWNYKQTLTLALASRISPAGGLTSLRIIFVNFEKIV